MFLTKSSAQQQQNVQKYITWHSISPVNSWSKNHDIVSRELDVMWGTIVCEVEIVGGARPLRCYSIYLLHQRLDILCLTRLSHYQLSAVTNQNLHLMPIGFAQTGLTLQQKSGQV